MLNIKISYDEMLLYSTPEAAVGTLGTPLTDVSLLSCFPPSDETSSTKLEDLKRMCSHSDSDSAVTSSCINTTCVCLSASNREIDRYSGFYEHVDRYLIIPITFICLFIYLIHLFPY